MGNVYVVLRNPTTKQKIERRQSKRITDLKKQKYNTSDAECEPHIYLTQSLFNNYFVLTILTILLFCNSFKGSEISGKNRNRKNLYFVQTVSDCGTIYALVTWLHACYLDPDCIRRFTAVRPSSVTHKPLYSFTLRCRASSGCARVQDLTIKSLSLVMTNLHPLRKRPEISEVGQWPGKCLRFSRKVWLCLVWGFGSFWVMIVIFFFFLLLWTLKSSQREGCGVLRALTAGMHADISLGH